jgi:hypothetical protein
MDISRQGTAKGGVIVKKPTIEQRLIDAQPEGCGNQDFVARTMNAIEDAHRKTHAHEIFSRTMRTMDVNKKETFIMKLKQLPIGVLIALAVAGIGITSGTAYAAFQAWQSAVVKTGKATTNQYGRSEVPVDIAQCSSIKDEDIKAEVGAGSTLDPKEIAKVLQARCEFDEVIAYGSKLSSDAQLPLTSDIGIGPSDVVTDYRLSGYSITIPSSAYSPEKTLEITPDTLFIARGALIKASDIKPTGDSIMYVSRERWTSAGVGSPQVYSPVGATALAVIKMSLPSRYYSQDMQAKLSLRVPCEGNPSDSCVRNSAGLMIYSYTSDENDPTKPAIPNPIVYIEGLITKYNDTSLQIKTSSGRLLTFKTPAHFIDSFNEHPKEHFEDVKLAVGDMLSIAYNSTASTGNQTIELKAISYMRVMFNSSTKVGENVKY